MTRLLYDPRTGSFGYYDTDPERTWRQIPYYATAALVADYMDTILYNMKNKGGGCYLVEETLGFEYGPDGLEDALFWIKQINRYIALRDRLSPEVFREYQEENPRE